MLRRWIIPLILCACLLPLSHANGCTEPSNPKTHTYKNINDFQSSRKSFSNDTFAKWDWVTFENGTFDTLAKNSFVSFQSEFIVRLFLDNHEISEIDEGAFYQLNCVMVLQLSNNKIKDISRGVLEDLKHLMELDLSHNALQEIRDSTFVGNPHMTKLNLTSNRIRVLNSESFNNLSRLEKLDLSYNDLARIHPSVFSYFHSLKTLQLGSNELEDIGFNRMPSSGLTLLNLTWNNLESFDTTDDYPFSATLKELYLGSNLLTKLNPSGLKNNFHSLKIIDIDDNPWFCPNLFAVLAYFNDSRIDYKGSVNPGEGESSVGGIPCNQSFEEYRRKHNVEPTTLPPATSPRSSPSGNSSLTNLKQFVKTNKQILDSLNSLYSLVVALVVIIMIVIVAELLYRGGCYWNSRRRRHHQQVLDNADVENFSLLRERF